MVVFSRILTVAVVAAGAAGSSLSAQSDNATDPTLLEIAGRSYRLSEILRSYEQRHRGHLSLLTGEAELRRLVERVRDHRLLVLEAEAQGFLDGPVLKEMLADYEGQLVRTRFMDELTTTDVAVDVEEVDELRRRLTVAYHVLEIGTATRAAAERARQRVLGGEEFATVAEQISILPSRVRSGAVAPKRYDELQPEVREWFLTATPGSISRPVVASQGYMLYMLLRTETVELPQRANVKTRLLSWIMQQKVEQRRNDLRDRLRRDFQAEVVEDIDLALFLPNASTGGDQILARAKEVEPVRVKDVRAILGLSEDVRQDPELLTEVVEFAAWKILDDRLLDAEAFRSGAASDPSIMNQVSDFRDDLAVKFMKGGLMYHDLEVKEERLRELYRERSAELAAPAEVELQHIVSSSLEDAMEAAAELERGKSFDEVARALSIDQATASSGGRVGWVSPDLIHTELGSYVLSTPLGIVSSPIQTSAGWHLLRVLRRRPGQERSFEQLRKKLYEDELLRMRNVELEKWTALLRDRVEWRIYDRNLPIALQVVRRKIEQQGGSAAPQESR